MRKAVVAGATMGALMFAGALFHWTGVSSDGNVPGGPPSQVHSVASQVHTLNPPRMAEVRLAPTLPAPMAQDIIAQRGDTLMKLLVKNAIAPDQAHAVIVALRPVYDPRRMRIGQRFSLTLASENAEHAEHASNEPPSSGDEVNHPGLLSLSFRPSVDQDIIVSRDPQRQFTVEVIDRLFERRDSYGQGLISTSLYDSAIGAKLPMDVLIRLIQMFSFDVDFQREVQPGDAFAVLYDAYHDEMGEQVRTGQIAWASMTLSGKTLEYAQYKTKSGFADYYDRRAQSVKKTLMRTPINGARLSSGFGKRRHPVLGYTKVHRGVDFAAPKGVPIMAAGDGVIESIGRNGSYGKYIRIRHNSNYKTAYAHMSRYQRGLKRGTRVSQGSTIGYVGSTGRSTGPHLHYEVLKNGHQVNPMSVRLPAGEKLQGKARKAFLAIWPALDNRVALTRSSQDVASD
jgi:murein DD-endopeptidase MepM/ murein hydrolase activator NlpD